MGKHCGTGGTGHTLRTA
ncbi:hypothetical protein H7I02_16765 [Mycolicibacterium brumae]|nr:hypothetical protein [Mycolicibacterium brumae]